MVARAGEIEMKLTEQCGFASESLSGGLPGQWYAQATDSVPTQTPSSEVPPYCLFGTRGPLAERTGAFNLGGLSEMCGSSHRSVREGLYAPSAIGCSHSDDALAA